MSITIPLSAEDTRKVSDGYHTFEELYEHRCLLFFNFVIQSEWKSAWKPHYPGWPVLFLETPYGQISYHFPESMIAMVELHVDRDDNYQWDGHTVADVISRMKEILLT